MGGAGLELGVSCFECRCWVFPSSFPSKLKTRLSRRFRTIDNMVPSPRPKSDTKFTMPSYVRPPSQSKRSYLPFSTPSSHGSPPHTRPGLPSPIAPPQSPPSPSPIRSLQGSHQAPTDSSTGTDHHRARHRRHTTPGHLQYHLQYHRLPAHSPSGLTPSQSLPHPRTLKMAPYTLLIRTRSSKKDTPCRSWGTSTEPLFCPGHARRY